MKIIKEGKKILMEADFICEPIFECTCDRCECIFDFTKEDAKWWESCAECVDTFETNFIVGRNMRFIRKQKTETYSVICPNCNKNIRYVRVISDWVERSKQSCYGDWFPWRVYDCNWEDIKKVYES